MSDRSETHVGIILPEKEAVVTLVSECRDTKALMRVVDAFIDEVL